MELAIVIDQVINTLKILNIQPTYDNVNHMTGIYQALFYVHDQLVQKTEAPADEPSQEAQEPEIVSEETVGGTAE